MLVFRKGATQSNWKQELNDDSIDVDKQGSHVDITFQVPVPGGFTDISVRFFTEDVKEVFGITNASQADVDAAYARGMEAVLDKMDKSQLVKIIMEKD